MSRSGAGRVDAVDAELGCSQECHLYDSAFKDCRIPYTHGADPHVGSASGGCLDCHSTSASVGDPGAGPHHSGQATGFTACGSCHATYKRRAGEFHKAQKRGPKSTSVRCHRSASRHGNGGTGPKGCYGGQ